MYPQNKWPENNVDPDAERDFIKLFNDSEPEDEIL